MILARIRVTGTCAVLTEWKEVPKGIRGAEIAIVYEDPTWDSLQKTVVFKGCVTRDVVNAGELVTIPPECVERAGAPLRVGIFGTDAGNNLAIPTLWADLGRVRDATDPSGDESTVEALPVWAQILALIGDLDDLATDAKATLVAAINEAATKGGGSVSEEEVWDIVDRYLQENPPVFAETDPTVPSWAKQPQKPSYSAQEVGAEPAGTATAAVSGHNASTDAHNDLRLELNSISSRLNAFFDSDDQTLDELSEIVAYITSNKSLIDAITTSKVSVSDIVDNLTTNVGHRPLSAAQGVVLKGLIDAVSRSLSNYQPKGDYLGREELPEAVNDALAQAKASGEFKGDPGKDGAAGKDGYAPVKGVDYFDGKDGQNGSPGKDGVSVTHVWDGTVLTVTSASGTSSADLRGAPGEPGKDGTSVAISSITGSDESGGENVVIFSNGRPLVIKNGLDGKPGKDGADGKDGVGIKKITTEETEIGPYTGRHIDIELTNGGGASFNVYNGIHGHDGADGVGIDYVDTFGPTVDGYTMVNLHLTNGNTESFDVYHGKNGEPGKDGTSVTVKSVSASNADGGSNVVTFSDGKTLTVKNGSKGSTGERGERGERGETGKTAYEYAKDGGYTGTEAQFSEKLAEEMPDKLPNPNALTIDGKTYDGSAAVDVQLPTELPNPNALVINGKRYDGTEFVNMNIEGNVVSNWLAKSGQPGHILFRPFYEVPEVTLSDNVEVTSGYYNWINYKAVADYEKVTVDYDGTTYICPITFQESHSPDLHDESFFYIGNLNGDAPEYPFSIVGYRNNDVSSIVVGSGTHTLSVKLEAFVKKIDAKFLPNDDDGEVVDWDVLQKTNYILDEYAGIDFEEIEPLVVGKTYIISINGVEYEREAKFHESDGWEQTYIGSIFGDPAYETDDEFSFFTFDAGGGGFAMKSDYANKTIELGVREKTENSGTGDNGSSGGVSSWNDLTDRPFYSETVIVDPVFDGDMTGKESVLSDPDTGAYAVKIAAQTVTVAELIGSTAVLSMGGADQSMPITSTNAIDASHVLGVPGAVVGQGESPIILSLPEDALIQGAFFSAGTWFMCIPGAFYVKSLSCLNPYQKEIVRPLDGKYLPFRHKRYTIEYAASDLTADSATTLAVNERKQLEALKLFTELSSISTISINLSVSVPGIGEVMRLPAMFEVKNAANSTNGCLAAFSFEGTIGNDSDGHAPAFGTVSITKAVMTVLPVSYYQAIEAMGAVFTIDVLYV